MRTPCSNDRDGWFVYACLALGATGIAFVAFVFCDDQLDWNIL